MHKPFHHILLKSNTFFIVLVTYTLLVQIYIYIYTKLIASKFFVHLYSLKLSLKFIDFNKKRYCIEKINNKWKQSG